MTGSIQISAAVYPLKPLGKSGDVLCWSYRRLLQSIAPWQLNAVVHQHWASARHSGAWRHLPSLWLGGDAITWRCGESKGREIDLVVAWTWRFRKGDAECQDQTWSWETKVVGVSQKSLLEKAGRQWKLRNMIGWNTCTICSMVQSHYSFKTVGESNYWRQQTFPEVWEKFVGNFCIDFKSIWTLLLQEVSLCLNSQRCSSRSQPFF